MFRSKVQCNFKMKVILNYSVTRLCNLYSYLLTFKRQEKINKRNEEMKKNLSIQITQIVSYLELRHCFSKSVLSFFQQHANGQFVICIKLQIKHSDQNYQITSYKLQL